MYDGFMQKFVFNGQTCTGCRNWSIRGVGVQHRLQTHFLYILTIKALVTYVTAQVLLEPVKSHSNYWLLGLREPFKLALNSVIARQNYDVSWVSDIQVLGQRASQDG